MPEVELSPEREIRHESFDVRIEKRYGREFRHAWIDAKSLDPQELAENISQFPDPGMLRAALRSAYEIKLVEWNTDREDKNSLGVRNWRYVVKTSEPRPDGKGNYEIYKVLGFDYKDNQWKQEMTYLSEKSCRQAMVERIEASIYGSLQEALPRFSPELYDAYTGESVLSAVETLTLPEGRRLFELAGENANISFLGRHEVKNYWEELPDEEQAVKQKMGEGFLAEYLKAKEKPYSFDTASVNELSQLPNINTLRKAGDWSGHKFYFVRWKENDEEKWAYVSPVTENQASSGVNSHRLELYTHLVSNPEDLSLEFVFYNPDAKESKTASQNVWMIEQSMGTSKLIQLLRPLGKDNWENLWLGVEDQRTGQVWVPTDMYPQITVISNPERDGIYMSLAGIPVMFMKSLSLDAPENVYLNKYSKHKTTILEPLHDFSHFRGQIDFMREVGVAGLAKYLRNITHVGPRIFTSVLPALYLSLGKGLLDSPSIHTLASPATAGAILTGNREFGMEWMDIEESAERDSVLGLRALRNRGFEMHNEMPDVMMSFFVYQRWWELLNSSYKIMTKPKLPGKLR
jgi:hypothetical protein